MAVTCAVNGEFTQKIEKATAAHVRVFRQRYDAARAFIMGADRYKRQTGSDALDRLQERMIHVLRVYVNGTLRSAAEVNIADWRGRMLKSYNGNNIFNFVSALYGEADRLKKSTYKDYSDESFLKALSDLTAALRRVADKRASGVDAAAERESVLGRLEYVNMHQFTSMEKTMQSALTALLELALLQELGAAVQNNKLDEMLGLLTSAGRLNAGCAKLPWPIEPRGEPKDAGRPPLPDPSRIVRTEARKEQD